MGSFSLWHWIIVIVVVAMYLVPAIMIIRKAGYSGWWCLLLFIPIVNVVTIWVFAFARWPNLRDQAI